MNAHREIQKAISDNIFIKQKLLDHVYVRKISEIADLIFRSLKSGKKLLICGNGGSAADAQHTAAELVNRFKIDRKPIAAIALTTDTSILTSIANDYDYNQIFKKQIEALGKKGDILLAISTSGRSKNVLEAVKAAKKIGVKTIGFTGSNASPLANQAHLSFKAPSLEVARIQESHILVIHIICDLIERRLCGDLHASR